MNNARIPLTLAAMLACGSALATPALASTEPAPADADQTQTAAPQTTPAPPADTGGLQDIIVTAQRREEHLQNVPIAVNVIGGAELARSGITDTKSVAALVPGLDFQQIGGSASVVYLRGVGSNDGNPNAEPSVATYIDGVYIASNSANVLDLNNIQRVEVLKGPQGTLFGRNATGGVIQVITRDPKQELGLEGQLGYGRFNTIDGAFYGTTGITPDAAIDLAVQFSDQGKGWGTNLLTGHDTYKNSGFSVRSKLLITPGDSTEIRISGDYSQRLGDGPSYRVPVSLSGLPIPPGKYDARADVGFRGYTDDVGESRSWGGSVNIQHEFGDVTGRSITAYRGFKGLYVLDEDTDPAVIVSAYLPETQSSISQELQAFWSKNGLDWTFGGFLFQSDSAYDGAELSGAAFGGTLGITGKQRTRSASAYGQLTAEIASDTKVTGGLRYTAENTRYLASVNGTGLPATERNFNKFTWRLALDHEFSNQIHGYISYNRGIKGGGFDLLTPGSTGFKPEILDAYEVGLKSKLLNNHLRFNASAFLYEYQDIQVQVIPAGSVVTNNAGAARIKGVDVDFEAAVARNFTISGGFAWLEGHYTRFPNAVGYPSVAADGPSFVFDATGRDTIRTPKVTGNVTATYTIPSAIGDFSISGTASYSDGYYFDAENRLAQPSYTLLNGTVGWKSPDGKYGITVWGRNLLNEYYYSQGVPSGVGDLLTPAAPATYGVRFNVKY